MKSTTRQAFDAQKLGRWLWIFVKTSKVLRPQAQIYSNFLKNFQKSVDNFILSWYHSISTQFDRVLIFCKKVW